MMQVRGSALISMQQIIPREFGRSAYHKWLDSLEYEIERLYLHSISPSQWFPIDTHLVEPSKKFCSLFYDNDLRGAWDLGRFSAEYSLRGVYKMFVKLGSVEFIINRATKILPSYYKPCTLEIGTYNEFYCEVLITEFPDSSEIIEYRIGGWIERALEIHGCSDITIEFAERMVNGDPITKYSIRWK